VAAVARYRFIDRLAPLDDPRSLGEALRGKELGDFWKYRVGDWRIIADLDDGVIVITVIRLRSRRQFYTK
jgi:mRNA interferase RelE/StbE